MWLSTVRQLERKVCTISQKHINISTSQQQTEREYKMGQAYFALFLLVEYSYVLKLTYQTILLCY